MGGRGWNAPCLLAASYVQALSLLLTLSFKRWQAWGFPRNSDSKESTCQCGRLRFDPWVRKIPGSGRPPEGGHGNPFQYCCLENPTDRGAWQVSVHRVSELDTADLECTRGLLCRSQVYKLQLPGLREILNLTLHLFSFS